MIINRRNTNNPFLNWFLDIICLIIIMLLL
jgi:hypothetical protein